MHDRNGGQISSS